MGQTPQTSPVMAGLEPARHARAVGRRVLRKQRRPLAPTPSPYLMLLGSALHALLGEFAMLALA